MSKTRVIIKSRCKVLGEWYTQWAEAVGVKTARSRRVSVAECEPKRAREVIEEEGLVPVYRDEDGTVFDLPGEPFKKAGFRAGEVREVKGRFVKDRTNQNN